MTTHTWQTGASPETSDPVAAPSGSPFAPAHAAPSPAGAIETREVSRLPVGGLLLATFGAVLIAAWGGIAPYVGPVFGFHADAVGSWTWNLPHALLALVPGGIVVLVALMVISHAPGLRVGAGRAGLRMAGVVAMLAGAWFVVGPTAWPVLEGGRYLMAGSPWGTLMRSIGFSFGPGVLLVAYGAFAFGWAGRLIAGPTHDVVPTAAVRTF